MRLSKQEIDNITKAVKKFDENAKIYLFGSRANDNLKGGDIDLLIISSKIKLREKLKIKTRLWDTIGDQKIDIVITPEINSPFLEMIYSESVAINE